MILSVGYSHFCMFTFLYLQQLVVFFADKSHIIICLTLPKLHNMTHTSNLYCRKPSTKWTLSVSVFYACYGIDKTIIQQAKESNYPRAH